MSEQDHDGAVEDVITTMLAIGSSHPYLSMDDEIATVRALAAKCAELERLIPLARLGYASLVDTEDAPNDWVLRDFSRDVEWFSKSCFADATDGRHE